MLRLMIWLLPAILLLAVLMWWLKPPSQQAPVPTAVRTSNLDAEITEFDHRMTLRVVAGRRAAGPGVLRLNQFETVQIVVQADVPGSLHLHGYDLQARITPEQPGELRFLAEYSGRFEFEMHDGEQEFTLGAIEVYPP